MATTVRCVFSVEGDADAVAPAPLVADVSCLSAGRLRKYALAAVAHHPKILVSVLVDGKPLTGRDGDLVDVPTACLVKPSAAKRQPRGDAKKDGDAADAEPAAEAADAAEAGDDKPAAEAAAAADDAAPAKDAAAEEEGDAPAAAAAADDAAGAKEEGESTEAKAKDGEAPAEGEAKSPKKAPKRKPQYQPRTPPKDLPVTVVVRPLSSGRLPMNRDLLHGATAAKITVCSKCAKCPVPSTPDNGSDAATLFDCGHIACLACRKAANPPAEGESKGPARVSCPTCGFHTYTNAAFPPADQARAPGVVSQVAPDAFTRSPHEAVAASTRVSSCAVCKAKDAVGRCAVEQLNMCESCHEEHLPSGPLRNSHTLLRFDSENAADALSVLCTNSLHRNLPVGYFCVDHGVLGCHMCLKDSTTHENCSIVTARDDLAGVAVDLRKEREAETSKVNSDAAAATRTAWDSYDKLRTAYEAQRAEINAKADAYKEAVDRQRQAALAHLHSCYADSIDRWESRITALDAVRARAATVAATLDGHRALPSGMLLHCEAANGLSFLQGVDEATASAAAALAEPSSIANLVVRFRKEMPSLFDVNGSHPTVDGEASAPGAAVVKAASVRVNQVPLATVAKRWKAEAAKREAKEAKAAPAAAAGADAAGAKKPKVKGVAGTVAAVEAAVNKSHGETPRVVPKPASPTAEGEAPAADAAPASPTSDAAVPLSDVAAVTKGPRDTILLVDRERSAVVAAAIPKGKHPQCKVTAVLGGGSEESFMFKSATETVTVAANKDHALKQPLHAVHHAKAKMVVVCDSGNDRIALYPDTFKPSGEGGCIASPEGVVKAPMAVAVEPVTGNIIVFERQGVVVLTPDASKVSRKFKYTQAPNKALSNTAAYSVAVTNSAQHSFIAMIRANGDVHFVNTAAGTLLGEYTGGRVVDPATAKAMRSGKGDAPAPAAPAGKGAAAAAAKAVPVSAIAAHPEANVVALVSRAAAADAWAVQVTLVGFEDGHADPQPAQPAHQPGGRRKEPAQPAKPAAPALKILKSTTLPLAALPRTDSDSSVNVVAADFDGPARLLVGVREVVAKMAPSADGGDATLRQEVGPLRFAFFAA